MKFITQIQFKCTCNTENVIDFLIFCKKNNIIIDDSSFDNDNYIIYNAILKNTITPRQYFELHGEDHSYLDEIYEMTTHQITLPSPDSPDYTDIVKANEESRKEHEHVKSFIKKYNAIVNPPKNFMDDREFRKRLDTMCYDVYYNAIIEDCNRIIAAYAQYPDSTHLSNTQYIKNKCMGFDRDDYGYRTSTPKHALTMLIKTNFSPLGGRFDPLIDGPEDVCVFTETAKAIGVEL